MGIALMKYNDKELVVTKSKISFDKSHLIFF